jgi:S-disulfanyl-L-cysteine oxidoreductase SoxD
MVRRMRLHFGMALLLAVALEGQPPASVWDGVYAPAQADRGKSLYAAQCASCHGAVLDGSGQAPPLTGADFKSNWNGQSADDLFEKIQATMPADQPGKLSRPETADILAFVLTTNGFPPGDHDLPSDAAALAKIRFEAAKPK